MLPGRRKTGLRWVENSASPLVDMSDICAIFKACFALGGATAMLQLVNHDAFLAATQQALASSERATEIEPRAHPEPGFGIIYHGFGTDNDVLGKLLADMCSVLHDCEKKRRTTMVTQSWVHGGLCGGCATTWAHSSRTWLFRASAFQSSPCWVRRTTVRGS